jgi:hypothetical protein
MTASAQLDGRIDWTSTFAALVSANPGPGIPAGTFAWTTDLGRCTWNGTSWGPSDNSVATIAANSGAAQTGATPILTRVVIATSAGSAYSVLLPVSAPGLTITVLTSTATNTVAVFPNAGGTTTETINALSANAGITMAARTSATFYCVVAGQWYTNPRVPS